IGVFDHLDAIAPWVEKIEEGSRQELAARLFDPSAHARSIVHHKSEMPAAVFMRRCGFHQVDELVAELDEGIARPLCSQSEIEDLSVELESLLDTTDLEGDVVDAHEARLCRAGLTDLGHMHPSSWSV